jgi:hypothetical protein
MTNLQQSQNEECWTLSPNPTNTTWIEKQMNFKNHLPDDGQIEQGKQDVDTHQGVDTLVVFVRKSSRVSGVISMSRFLSHNKTHVLTCVTDLWRGQVSYNWYCPHHGQYVYFIRVSYHGHYLVIPSQHLQRSVGSLCVCCPCRNLVGSRVEVDRADWW